MDCNGTIDLLSAFLDGDLPERDREKFAEHLRQCPRCAGEEKALKETLSLLRNLSVEKAPPGLLEGVRRRIGQEKEPVPLWKKLFLPAHVKIPLEAAAVVLIFLLAYGIQKEMPPSKTPPASPKMEMAAREASPPPPGGVVSEKRSPAADIPAGRRKADPSPGLPAEVADRIVEAKKATSGRSPGTPSETGKVATPVLPPVKRPVLAQSEIPAGLASRVSTKGGSIEPAAPREPPAKETPGPREFGKQLARLAKPSPYGKEVTIEVDRNDREGMENRIAELALRLGGMVRRGGTFAAGSEPGELTILSEVLQVRIPADSEDDFLEELGKMGTIPPEKETEKTDMAADPSPGNVIYTVRIRIR